MIKMEINLNDVFDFIREYARRQAYENLRTNDYKTDYKAHVKGAISALIYLRIMREDDIEMVLNEFDRVCEKEIDKLIQKSVFNYAR